MEKIKNEENISLPEISARHLSDSFFNPDFNFEKLDFPKSEDFGVLPAFSPVDVNRYVLPLTSTLNSWFLRALEQLKITPKKEEKKSRIGSDVSFFSPSKIISNKIKIVENIDEAKALRTGKLVRSRRKIKQNSPVNPTNLKSLCGLNKEPTPKHLTSG